MQISARTVKERLLSNLESVLTHLFPNGKTIGHEFRVGSIDGEAGKSLAVELRGPDRGAWQDFAHPNDPEQRGDVMSLWCRAKRQTFKEAFPGMKRFAGFTQVEPVRRQPKPTVSTDGILHLTPEVHEYLAGRGLSDPTLKRYRIRSHKRNSPDNDQFVLFPFIDSEGDPVMIKSTGINKRADGTKDIWTSQPYYTLWGWWLVDDDCREIVICEGEIDAMSLHQLGCPLPVLSVPSGVSNTDWIGNDFEALQRYERIYLVFDMDNPHPKTGLRPGEEGAREISRRLGAARCLRIPVPGGVKDVNDALLSGDERMTSWDYWLSGAYSFSPPTVSGVSDFRDGAHARLLRQRRLAEENSFIWPGVPFQFRDGEMTVISGYPHGGKSAWLYQVHAHELFMGQKVFLCSFEIEPEAMLLEICQVLTGGVQSEAELDRTIDFLDGKLFFFRPNARERTELAELLADLDYVVQRYGVRRLAVDSLHFLARKEDYEGQDNVSLQLTRFAKSRNVHVALVCHSVVKKGEEVIPGLSMVEGSGGITKPVDNGITIWRNVRKQEAILKAEENDDSGKKEQAERMHDAVMKFWKNRENGKLPMVKLWFDAHGKSFRLKREDEIYSPLRPKPEESAEELF